MRTRLPISISIEPVDFFISSDFLAKPYDRCRAGDLREAAVACAYAAAIKQITSMAVKTNLRL